MRLRRADYPEATSQNIFNRMKSEREREAKGSVQRVRKRRKIRATAEKTRTVIISEAKRTAQVRGPGDSEAISIYADSFGQDADFLPFIGLWKPIEIQWEGWYLNGFVA